MSVAERGFVPRVGLVLGGGAARGWSHIGVIRALEQSGVRPDLVCGTSIGALVGAAYAAGELDRLESWASRLKFREVFSLMDFAFGGSMLKGERLVRFFRGRFRDRPIEELTMPFAAVATVLHTGAEAWLRSGSVVDAVRASAALPGIFAPVERAGRLLVDGGLVDPVPVSLARAMDADVVIAVDLASDLIGRHLVGSAGAATEPSNGDGGNGWMQRARETFAGILPAPSAARPQVPSALDVLATGLNIMQVRITRSRMAGEPPDVIVAPRLAHFGLFDFHRATEAIEAGRAAVQAALPSLRALGLAKS